MSIGLIGTKIGMTREFMDSGQSVPVTVIKIEKGRVLDIISQENRGYSAIKVGFFSLKNSRKAIVRPPKKSNIKIVLNILEIFIINLSVKG